MSVSNRIYKQRARLPKYRPLPWRVFIWKVLARDPVLWISLGLALASSLWVRPPLSAYAGYMDFKTLGCLAALMAASGGLMISGVFDRAAAWVVNRCGCVRTLTGCLVFATFLSSMFITNDVALIVFVPVTLMVFSRAGADAALTVVLQTVAANAGSVLLPMGNPQNLYLYSRYGMEFWSFFRTVLPLSLAGALVLGLFCLCLRRSGVRCGTAEEPLLRSRDARFYALLFLAAVLAVFDVLDYRLVLLAVAAAMLWKGGYLVQQIDYALLLTFMGFFVFVGNVSRVPAVQVFMGEFVAPRPFLAAVLSSQVISNVPAAVMLSGFTEDAHALLAGVSAGGFGTLIASMASLISYKLYVRDGGNRKRFLWLFTLVNLLFLAVMCAAYSLHS